MWSLSSHPETRQRQKKKKKKKKIYIYISNFKNNRVIKE